MVVDVVVRRKPGARVLRLLPRAVGALRGDQPRHPALDRLRALQPLAGRVQRQQRPRRLRGGRVAAADPRGVIVGARVLAPAAVLVVVCVQPLHRPADRLLLGADAHRRERRQRRAGAIDVVDPPAPKPRSVRLLLPQQPAQPRAGLFAVGAAERGEHLQRVRGHVSARLVDHLAEIQERERPHQGPRVVGVERPPAAALALHPLDPLDGAIDRVLRALAHPLRTVRRRHFAVAAAVAVGAARLLGFQLDRAQQRQCHLRGVVDIGVVVILELKRPSPRLQLRLAPPPNRRARAPPPPAATARRASAPGAHAAVPASLSATIASAVSHTGDWQASRRRLGGRDSRPALQPRLSSRSSTMKRSNPSRPRRITG